MAVKTEYTEELKELLQTMYSPTKERTDETEIIRLRDLYYEVTSILPHEWIDESDLYQALQELGFVAKNIKTVVKYKDDDGKEHTRNQYNLFYLLNMN